MKKSGYKTSEFFLAGAALVLALANQAGFVGQPISSDALIALSGIVASYALSRGIIKRGGR